MEPWYWLNDNSRAFLARGYLSEGQTAEERIRVIADTAEKYLKRDGFSDKFYEYMSKGWISLASPVWSNFGIKKGLPISCFGSYVDDNMGSILHTTAEVGMMSKYGGGCSGYFGSVRERGASISDNNGHSSGSVHFMQLFETLVDVVSQGSVRRGHFSPYLPASHPDIMEFLDIGTEGNPIQKLTHGVTVDDTWMEDMIGGDEDKRKIWARIIQRRGEMGYPYIMFNDTANKNTVDVYKEKDLKIYASNMCSEIMLPSKEDWSFVCCLSSVNMLHYDDWKDTDLVETMTAFLDAVMEDFIVKLEELRDSKDVEKQKSFQFMERAYTFAKANRALGLGVLGYHSLLQAKGLAFESDEAAALNKEAFKLIHEKALASTKQLAEELGEPEVLKGYGRRNTTTMAIAPTTSSAFILGQVSQGIEPIWSNCYVKDVAKMKVTIKNPTLKILLAKKDKDTKEVWDSVRNADGSVQHLDCLNDDEKAIFRTFSEIKQGKIVEQAGARQQYIDQGQSLNIMLAPDTPVKEINKLYIKAWKEGIKSLYYQHSMNAAQQLVRKKLIEAEGK
ncbi:MAG: ribonucleoside-diphosphate reductase subunit alpha [Candidatus Pacebacteria bacterium]|nr:ribonucleoside-diphosphate reductase subunit alpha [Candidatus Paceibacterota bacterium]